MCMKDQRRTRRGFGNGMSSDAARATTVLLWMTVGEATTSTDRRRLITTGLEIAFLRVHGIGIRRRATGTTVAAATEIVVVIGRETGLRRPLEAIMTTVVRGHPSHLSSRHPRSRPHNEKNTVYPAPVRFPLATVTTTAIHTMKTDTLTLEVNINAMSRTTTTAILDTMAAIIRMIVVQSVTSAFLHQASRLQGYSETHTRRRSRCCPPNPVGLLPELLRLRYHRRIHPCSKITMRYLSRCASPLPLSMCIHRHQCPCLPAQVSMHL